MCNPTLFIVWIKAVNRTKCCKKRSPPVFGVITISRLQTKAERLHLCWRGGEALKCRWRRVSPVRSTLTPAAEMSFFSRGKLWCGISRRGGLVMIAPFWLSASENKVFMLCQSHISSLYFSDETSSSIIVTSYLRSEFTDAADYIYSKFSVQPEDKLWRNQLDGTELKFYFTDE